MPILSLRRISVKNLWLYFLLHQVSCLETEQSIEAAIETYAVGQLLVAFRDVPVHSHVFAFVGCFSFYYLSCLHINLLANDQYNILGGCLFLDTDAQTEVLLLLWINGIWVFKEWSQIVITVKVIHVIRTISCFSKLFSFFEFLISFWISKLFDWNRLDALFYVYAHFVLILFESRYFIKV